MYYSWLVIRRRLVQISAGTPAILAGTSCAVLQSLQANDGVVPWNRPRLAPVHIFPVPLFNNNFKESTYLENGKRQEFENLLISTANSVKCKIFSISEYQSRTIIGGSQSLRVCQDWVLLPTKQKSAPIRITEAAGGSTSQKTVRIYQTTWCQLQLTPCCPTYMITHISNRI